jgi:hypothetical protein
LERYARSESNRSFVSRRSHLTRARPSHRCFAATNLMRTRRSWPRTSTALSGCPKTDLAGQSHKASADQTKILAAVQRPLAVQCVQEKAQARKTLRHKSSAAEIKEVNVMGYALPDVAGFSFGFAGRRPYETGVEVEAFLVSACGRRPHGQSKDSTIYGASHGREGPLEPSGP